MPLAQVLTARQGLVGCQTLVVEERTTSDIAARGLAGAVAWVPADESVPGRAGTTALADAPRTVVAESPIVLVSEGATGRVMGAGQPTGDLLTGLVTGATTYADLGHPEWGAFSIVSPDPATDPIGALGIGSLLVQAAGGTLPTDPGQATPEQLRAVVVEQRVVELVPQPDAVFAALAPSSDEGTRSGPRTGVTTEMALARWLDEQPGPDLAAVYAPGAPAARVALVTPTPDAEVTAFAEWLRTSDADVALAAAGLRNVTGTTWPEGLERAGLTPADVSPTGRPNTSA